MNAPLIARILGVLFLLAGVAGFVPWAAAPAPLDAPFLELDIAYRQIAGLFPVNVAHDAVHLLFGILGLIAGIRFGSAVVYLRSVTWIYLLLVLLGAIPITATLFGAVPIYGWDVGLHLVIVLFAAYGGYGRGSIEGEPEAA